MILEINVLILIFEKNRSTSIDEWLHHLVMESRFLIFVYRKMSKTVGYEEVLAEGSRTKTEVSILMDIL